VLIKHAPGHTPGHQILFLKLPQTGAVVLSGDLYHYPQMRTLDRVATFDWDENQTRATRTEIDAFLKRTAAGLWIQHDLPSNRKLRKSPGYYE
jgi:glyoxylase-like metal-dependent hydrolase (beta-lactamase superfamily II)